MPVNHNMLIRTIVPVSAITRSAINLLYTNCRTAEPVDAQHLSDALHCLVTHTPFPTQSEVEVVDDALAALDEAVTDPAYLGVALSITDVAAEPLLDSDRFDPTTWNTEVADSYLHDGGFVVPEAPLGWVWRECVGCSMPLPVRHNHDTAHPLCDACTEEKEDAA